MKTYIALLRGINVSGKKKILMADLKELLEKSGFTSLQTYIQSGNIIFTSESEDSHLLANSISKIIRDNYSFEVPVIVVCREELATILESCPFEGAIKEASYFTLIHSAPEQDVVDDVSAIALPNEQFHISKNCVYLYAEKGYGRAKGTNNFFEKKLGVTATTRNYKTMVKLLAFSS